MEVEVLSGQIMTATEGKLSPLILVRLEQILNCTRNGLLGEKTKGS